jgi:hypothetical protein
LPAQQSTRRPPIASPPSHPDHHHHHHTHHSDRLAVIGIANTHDIDERVLPRIASRLGSSKLAFVPYSAEQIKTIVKGRLAAVQQEAMVDNTAVDFAARKVGGGGAWQPASQPADQPASRPAGRGAGLLPPAWGCCLGA